VQDFDWRGEREVRREKKPIRKKGPEHLNAENIRSKGGPRGKVPHNVRKEGANSVKIEVARARRQKRARVGGKGTPVRRKGRAFRSGG